MLKIEIPQMYETKTSARKARNQFINLIVVLLIGIYGVHQTEEMFVIMGWTMIVLSSFILMIRMVSVIYFYLGEITYRLSKKHLKNRKLHYKIPSCLKEGELDETR